MIKNLKYHGVVQCDTCITRNDLTCLPKHVEPGRYFTGNEVNMVISRQAWIKHNSKIFKTINSLKNLIIIALMATVADPE